MKVGPGTKISELLKADEGMIDFIMSIHPKFHKLSNPFLRKAIAPRVTVRDAARIAGISTDEFLDKLAEKGFEIVREEAPDIRVVTECDIPYTRRLIRIDAAGMLERHEDPFDPVRKALLSLEPDQAVEIKLDFVPAPLIHIFGKQGYEHCTLEKDGAYYTYFYKPAPRKTFWQKVKEFLGIPAGKEEQPSTEGAVPDEAEFERALERWKGRMEEVDVRGLEMPQPMMTIQEKLKTLPPGKALFVHHQRIPQFLLPELEKKGYHWAVKRIDPDYTQMIIFKEDAHD
ncbi:MAG: DUF2249 domain-containing protein [Chlorobi bacterium]|nr:DUF2249 domain-containing protein [Chlorobiota bacterium]